MLLRFILQVSKFRLHPGVHSLYTPVYKYPTPGCIKNFLTWKKKIYLLRASISKVMLAVNSLTEIANKIIPKNFRMI